MNEESSRSSGDCMRANTASITLTMLSLSFISFTSLADDADYGIGFRYLDARMYLEGKLEIGLVVEQLLCDCSELLFPLLAHEVLDCE